MARAVSEKTDEPGTEVAVSGFSNTALVLDDSMAGELEGLTTLGYSEKSEDSLVPIVAILQDNSAEVKRAHSKYIQGAEAGKLIIRAMQLVLDPLDGIVIQPAGFQHMWVRWQGEPGEGSVVGQYPFEERPAEAKEVQLKPDDERLTWVMPDDTRLVDTRYHYCYMMINGNWMPVVIPMAGTNHGVSRGWTNIMKSFKVGQAQAPSWFRAYKLNTKFVQRGATQSWYTYDPKDLGWITDASQRNAGRLLAESVTKEVVAPDVTHESGGEVPGEKKDLPF